MLIDQLTDQPVVAGRAQELCQTLLTFGVLDDDVEPVPLNGRLTAPAAFTSSRHLAGDDLDDAGYRVLIRHAERFSHTDDQTQEIGSLTM